MTRLYSGRAFTQEELEAIREQNRGFAQVKSWLIHLEPKRFFSNG